MAVQQRIYHWKHGWIPLDEYARLEQANGRDTGKLKPDVAQRVQLMAPVRGMDELSPALQGKIANKLQDLTGMPESQLAARVQDNLVRLHNQGNQSELTWYGNEGADIARRASGVGTTPEKLTGMVAVTSAHKRWQENKDFAEAIARKLHENEPFQVDQPMIDAYNAWTANRRGDLMVPHPDLKPGTYRPSELPSDFAAAKTPRMPRHLNTDAVVQAVRIHRGESTVDQAIQGPKQRSFVNNLLAPADPRSVTNDTWHYRAAMSGISLKKTIGPKGAQRTYNYTLEQWGDRDLARIDGRAAMFGYDPSAPPSSAANVKAILKATPAPQEFFQSGPASKAENYDGSTGTYPWFTKQTQAAASKVGVTPAGLQAVAWYAVGGGV